MKKAAFTLFLILIILASAGLASADKLEIEQVAIISEGRTLLTTSGDSASFKADPGDSLYIEVRLENLYEDKTDNHIQDVRVSATIADIDDGSDIDDTEETNVLADSHKTVKLKLRIPSDASSYQSYDLVINARGTDQNGTAQSDRITIEMDVRRKENELVFETLQASDVDCDGYMNFRIELQNTGEEEEQDVELLVTSSSTGTLWSDRFDLYSINDDEYQDSTYRKTRNLYLGSLSPGSHYLRVRVLYDNSRKSLEKSLLFNVRDCSEKVPVTSSAAEDTTIRTTERYYNPNRDTSLLFGSKDVIEVQMPPANVPVPSPPQVPPSSGSDGFGTFVLVLANIAIIVFIILLLLTLRD